jgi:DNA-binding GntR family transcriptional regulator
MSTPDPAVTPRRANIAQHLYQVLRERIVSLEWKPGTLISRVEIAEEFDVSRTPVREALLQLEAVGLIDVYPQSRTMVSRIDVAKARESHFLRRAIEVEVGLHIAAMPDRSGLARLREVLARMREIAGDDGQLRTFMARDREFHRTLFELAGVPKLYDLAVESSGHMDRIRHLQLPIGGKRRNIVADHEAIVEAIAGGEQMAIVSAVRQHLSGRTTPIEDVIAAHPDYFAHQS